MKDKDVILLEGIYDKMELPLTRMASILDFIKRIKFTHNVDSLINLPDNIKNEVLNNLEQHLEHGKNFRKY